MSRSKFEIAPFWTIQLIGWPAYGLVSFLGVLPYVGLAPHLDSVRSALFSKMAFAATGIVFCSALRPCYRRENERGSSWLRISILVVAASYVAGTFATLAANAARLFAGGKHPSDGLSAYLGGAVNASAVFLAWSACYFAVRTYQALETQKRNTLRASALAHQAQLETLRSQINPHFLFNALNSIHALVGENPTRATSAIEELADFLRYSLACIKVPDVPLCQEIKSWKGISDSKKSDSKKNFAPKYTSMPPRGTFGYRDSCCNLSWKTRSSTACRRARCLCRFI